MIGAIVLTTEVEDKTLKTQQIYQQLSRSSQNAIFLVSLKK